MKYGRMVLVAIKIIVALAVLLLILQTIDFLDPVYEKCKSHVDYPKVANEIYDTSNTTSVENIMRWVNNFTKSKNCSDCVPNSIVFDYLAKYSNMTSRVIHDPGERHHWNEVLKDGEWLVVDVGYGINMAQRDYVRMGVWGKNLSFAYAEYQNGSKEDVTKFYTNTSLVIFNVVDANNLPVGGMEVLLKSNFLREWLPDNPQYTDSIDTQNYCITNSFGTCMLTVGGNNYTIEVRPQIIGLVYTTDRKIVIIAGENERDPYIITLRSNNFELTFIGKIFALFVVAVVVIVTVLLGLIYYARHRKPKKWSYRFKN